jgi:hypothetical protein
MLLHLRLKEKSYRLTLIMDVITISQHGPPPTGPGTATSAPWALSLVISVGSLVPADRRFNVAWWLNLGYI